MRKIMPNLGWLLLALSWLLPNSATAAADQPPKARMTVAVVEFAVRGELDEQAGAIMADLMMSAIANTGRFTLKDRLPLSAAAKIAKTQEFGSTGLLDPKTAAELGRLYGVDGIIAGGVNKLGDLITVTVRLIDTKSAALLRSGQIQGKDIDTIQVKVSELAAMIIAPPEALPEKPLYALTVQVDPVGANIRLLNSPTAYQAGMRLPAGDYEVEVTKPGYAPHKEAVRINDRDKALTVTLEKLRYGLTVRTEPTDAQIRLLNSQTPYQPGVALLPGDYEIEVARDGYVSRKIPVRVVDGDLSVPVALEKVATAPPAPPPVASPVQYRLTVQVDPPQATVRLLNTKTPYQPGMRLASGDYKVEVSQSGYTSQQISVQMVDSDVTVPVSLKPATSSPATYRLTVRSNPASARIRLVNAKTRYKPGVQLAPGAYTLEVAQSGYEAKQVTVQIVDSDVTVPVALTKEPEAPPPIQYRLTVRTDPVEAKVRLVGTKTRYKTGVLLPPGSYTLEVSQAGYETKRTTVRIEDNDVTASVALVRQQQPVEVPLSVQYRLTVQPDPPSARVRLVNAQKFYRPGVALPPGVYVVEVMQRGYEAKQVTVRIADGDVTMPVSLTRLTSSAPPVDTASPQSTRPGEWRIGAVQVDGSLNDQDRSEVLRVFNGYIGRTVTRATLLAGAMRVYQSTGVTLSFSLRPSSGGTTALYARASRRVRRTYESNIPMMTPSQLEQSGFGVSD